MTSPYTPLSRAGSQRREHILTTALREARRRRHRRFTLRCTLACAVLAGLALTAMHQFVGRHAVDHKMLVHHDAPIAPPTEPGRGPAPSPVADPEPVLRYRARQSIVVRVQTDPQMTTRLAVPPAAGSVARISDDQLLEQLALAHQPAGLARFGGKTVLMYRNPAHSRHSVK